MKITREELYRRVWETPVRTLAKEFDISDVGLAKACRRNRIPLPPVGYWMKVQHGKAVTKPPMSKSDSVEVTLQASRYRIPAPPASVEALKPPQLQVPLPETTDELAPVASATFKNLLEAKADIRGMLSCQGTNVFSCDVAPGTVERAVRILHAVESALPVIGAKLVKASKETLGDSANQVAAQLPVVAANKVPIAEFRFIEMPARYQPLNPPSDAHWINGGVP